MDLSLDGLSLDGQLPVERASGAELSCLTDDCLVTIFRSLPAWPDLAVASLVCRKFARIVSRHRGLWSRLELCGDHRRTGQAQPVVSDSVVAALARRAGPALESLSVRGCDRVTGVGLRAVVAHCGGRKLASIELSDCLGLCFCGVITLLSATNVQHLVLGGLHAATEPELTASESPTQNFRSLTNIKLDDCHFTADELASALQQCPRLQHLEIMAPPKEIAAQLAHVVAASTIAAQLHTLQLGKPMTRQWTESISMADESMQAEGSATMSQSFDGAEANQFRDDALAASDASIKHLFQRCSSGLLTSLELSGFCGLVGSSLEYAPCASLVQLSLRGCSGLVSLPLPECPALTSLDLEECCGLMDSTLIMIGVRCPALVELNLESCEHFCDAVINSAIEAGGFRCLLRINTMGCPLISSGGIVAMAHAGNGRLQQLAVGFDRAAVRSLNVPAAVSLPDDESMRAVWRWLAPMDTTGLSTVIHVCPLTALGEFNGHIYA